MGKMCLENSSLLVEERHIRHLCFFTASLQMRYVADAIYGGRATDKGKLREFPSLNSLFAASAMEFMKHKRRMSEDII